MEFEFRNADIPYKREEVKAISALADEHIAQTINYLKFSGNKLGLLVNFGELKLN
jgi:GxxExxY protein